ncbi:MAG: threonylcarbamoyl-AMP synthase [Oscillospiraceae bacterium]|nr:threonylcarbamoyl-AMP synthase [Oscillospiraceae bacterium]
MKTILIGGEITPAAKMLREGGLVAVPTETVYGLAGNGLDASVIERIYEVKGRPAVKPISLMVGNSGAIADLCAAVPQAALELAEKFWPGPLTLVLKARAGIPEILRAGGETVGLRCPRQQQTLQLLQKLSFPLAVPSANPSGLPSPKTADEVMQYFDGVIEAVIDGGPCELGLESTVLDMSQAPYRILRQGSLPAEEIEDALVEAMHIIGITGGSGSGKTTVLCELEKRGALMIDADAVYHEMLETDASMLSELREAFPSAVKGAGIDRAVLGGIVFRDPKALKHLNNITHSHISREIRNRLRAWAMQGGTLAAIDAIELHSSGASSLCDWTLAVTAPRETRIRRVMERDGITREAAERRISAQLSDEAFGELCDAALFNDGDLAALQRQLNIILEEHLNHGRKSERKPVL